MPFTILQMANTAFAKSILAVTGNVCISLLGPRLSMTLMARAIKWN